MKRRAVLSRRNRTLPRSGFREPLEALRCELEVKDLRDHLAPTVEEVAPAIVDLKATRVLLALRLPQEAKVATVVELPHDTSLGERCVVRDGRSRSILPEAGGVDDQ